jgi:anti-sigma factor (TIGR02949 family)
MKSKSVGCREAAERVFEFLDGELEDVSEEEIAEHFRVCGRCYPSLAFEQAFRDALARARRGEKAPADLRERVLEALRKEGYDP